MGDADKGYDNPAVIDLSDCTEVPYRESGQWIGERRPSRRRKVCENCASPLNSVAFVLLFLSIILCAVSAFSPFWIYYPRREPLPELDKFVVKFPFKKASWRGLWAVCYRDVDLNPRVSESRTPARCVWFGRSDNNAWETIPAWYDAAEVLFTIGLIMLVLAIVVESAFACCHCGLYKAFMPTAVGSLTLFGAVMCTASLAVFGDSSFQEGELTPEPSGQEGRLEWAFLVGIGGTCCTVLTSLLFYGAIRVQLRTAAAARAAGDPVVS